MWTEITKKKTALIGIYNETHGENEREREKRERTRSREEARKRQKRTHMKREKTVNCFVFFFSRLMIRIGTWFFFPHSPGKRTMSNDDDKIYFCAPLKMDVF